MLTMLLLLMLICVIFMTPYAQWAQIGQDIDGEAVGDQSGWSVSISSDGSIIAIGANTNDGPFWNSNRGHVRVYERNSTSWIQRGQDIDGEAAGDNYGQSVSLSADGSILAIGAIYNDPSGKSNAGHVRVYAWNCTSWIKRGQDIDGETRDDYSGWSVSLSADGSIVAIGAVVNDGASGTDRGQVRVYTWDGTSLWMQIGQDIDGEASDDQSGCSVSISANGSIVAIAARQNDGTATSAGHVRVYSLDGTSSWIQRGQDIDGEALGDNSGWSVSLSDDGSVVAIGAIYNDAGGSDAGHVRVYSWNSISSLWDKRGLDLDGEAANDYSGWSVSLSSDGTVVAIGASRNDGSGSDAGQVRVYHWNGLTWIKIGQDIDGEAGNDRSGTAISLSFDGSIVAIGAPSNDGTTMNANDNRGSVRVYAYITPTDAPSAAPSMQPSPLPSWSPSSPPSIIPTIVPSISPSYTPSYVPTIEPTLAPFVPTKAHSRRPTYNPSSEPSKQPRRFVKTFTKKPSRKPTRRPTRRVHNK